MKKTYDIAIIGGSLSGLLISAYMQKKGYKTCIIEQTSTVNRNLQVLEGAFQIERKFPLFFNTVKTRKALAFLSDILDEEISYEVKKINPLIFEKRSMSKVSQDTLPSILKKFPFYTQNNRLFLHKESHRWLPKILSFCSKDILFDHKVIDLKQENKKVTYCVCNNSQKIFADRFIFCASFNEIRSLLKNNPSFLLHQESSTIQEWIAISIDFVHPQKITDLSALHILLPSHKEQIYPFFGLFYPPQKEKKGQISQWLTFLNVSTSKEEEKHIEWAVKAIKKCIHAIYPHCLDRLLFERLFISRHYEYKDVNLTKQTILSGIENNFYVPTINEKQQLYHHRWIDHVSAVQVLVKQADFL